MDYSKYYLKNYKALRDGLEGVNYTNAYYRCYNEERQIKYEPSVIYTQPAPVGAEEDKRADIEYDPGAYTASAGKIYERSEKKGGIRRRIWLAALCLCLIALSCSATFLAADIITDGAVISAMKSQVAANNSNVYVSYLTGCVDYESAKLQSEEMRKQGLGGYIGLADGKYAVYADIAETKESVITEWEGASLNVANIALKQPSEENYSEEVAGAVLEYADYTRIFLGYMFEISEQLQIGGLTSAINACKEKAEEFEEYIGGFISSVEEEKSAELVKLTGDMRAEAAFLRTLSSAENGSEKLFLADIRYYSVLAVFNRNSNIK